MPAVTAGVFAVGGAALAGQRPRRKPVALGIRVPNAAALLIAAVIPALLMLSQDHLAGAAAAFQRDACPQAKSAAQASIDFLSVRPQPYQILGYCDIAQGHQQQTVLAIHCAVHQERRNGQYNYALLIEHA